MPFGSPFLSFEISPPKGVGVSLVIPAIFRAALFTTVPWPSARCKITGLFGATLSRSQRVGNTGGCQKHNPIALHSDSFRVRLPIIRGVDVAVNENKISRFDLRAGGRKVEEQN